MTEQESQVLRDNRHAYANTTCRISKMRLLLAICYMDGTLLEQSYENAFKWMDKASIGLLDAALIAGVMYEVGLGVTQDLNKALDTYNRASAYKFVNYAVYRFYDDGTVVAKDQALARRLLTDIQPADELEKLLNTCYRRTFACARRIRNLTSHNAPQILLDTEWRMFKNDLVQLLDALCCKYYE